MATGQGPVVESALLREELVRLRKEKSLTQEQIARKLDWSPSKLIRIEGGRSALTRTDLQALLHEYGASPSQQETLQELAAGAREPAWWTAYRDEISESYLTFVGFEAGASFIRQYHGGVIPGLMQTIEYATILTTGAAVDPLKVAHVVKLRLQRQTELASREDPAWQYFLLDEAAIRRHVGIKSDPTIMPRQLRHVLTLLEENPRLAVQVMPFSAGSHFGLFSNFTLLEFKGALTDLLNVESGSGDSNLFSGNDNRVAEYRAGFEEMLEEALSVEDSRALIESIADSMD